jgi:hypothetical protein
MILTVFSGGGGKASSRIQRLDEQVYRHTSEEELSALVNKVYEASVELLKRAANALLSIDTVAYLRDEAEVHRALARAHDRLEQLLDDAQDALMQTSQELSGTAEQRKHANTLYSAFLRALVASWKCVLHVSHGTNRELDAVKETLTASFRVHQCHDLSMYTLQARREVDDITARFAEGVQECVHRVELQRLAVTRRITTPIPLYVHAATCKNFIAHVREWAAHVMSSVPPPRPVPSFGAS